MRITVALWLLALFAGAAGAQTAAVETSCTPPAPGTPLSESGAALERGNTLAAHGDIDAALAAYAQSQALADAAGEDGFSLLARANAVRARLDAGRSDGATAEIDALLEAAAQLSDPRPRARLRTHLARSLAESGQVRRAAEVFTLASVDARGVDTRLESFALGYQAELYEQVGRRDDALGLTRRALFAAQRAEAPDALYRWQWQLARLQRASGEEEAALGSYREAVATLGSVRELGGAEVEPLYLEFVDLLLERAARAQGAASQALLVEARDALEDQKAGELRDYFQDPCLDAQRKQSPESVPGTLVVYPILLPDRIELIASRGGELTRYQVPVDRETLTREVRAFRQMLEKRTTRQYLPHARQLYDWLIRPLEPELRRDGVDTLVFVPGGPLRTIPLAALQDRTSGQYLIERFPLAITPSLTLTEPRRIDPGVRLLAAGISQSVQGYAALPNVEPEIDAVTADFPSRRLMNEAFVLKRFDLELKERTFGIVHLASHGEFSADSSQSFLLTFDGRISMDEMAALVGTTRFREQGLELLVLSACQTATGDDRAALGLAGVALRAGARSALASLWAVNDQASAELISEFYTQLKDSTVSRAEALRRAQLGVMHMHAYRHPGYWAPYLLISSWM